MLQKHFLFDRIRRKVVTLFVLCGDIFFLWLYSVIYTPDRQIMSPKDRVNKAVGISIVVITVSLISELYFDNIRQGVYDQLKDYSESIRKATEAKQSFFAAMSHEIRNPLQSLLGCVELINLGQESNQATLINIMKNCCEVVLNLVSNILDISKIEAQKLEVLPLPASLTENIGKILRLSTSKAESKGLILQYLEESNLPSCLLFDPQRLQQVILNIVSNAIKFTSKGKVVVRASWIPFEDPTRALLLELNQSDWKKVLEPIEEIEDPKSEQEKRQRIQRHFCQASAKSKDEVVRLRHSRSASTPYRDKNITSHKKSSSLESIYQKETAAPPYSQSVLRRALFERVKGLAKIEVMDTGIGIPKEAIKDLFQKYRQADRSISQQIQGCQMHRNYGGTGLGLWISRSIIHKMGGDIHIKSKVGFGTCVTVAFPSETCHEASLFAATQFKRSVHQSNFAGKTCIIVDDIPDNTYILSQLLETHGIHTLSFSRARPALDAYKERMNASLIITDLRLPEMSGQSLITEIRKYEKEQAKRKVPIIVLTGETSPNQKMLCLGQYGADEYLLKPIALNNLMEAIEKCVQKTMQEKIVRNILIVEDDPVGRSIIGTLIKQNGDKVCECSDVFEAVQAVERDKGNYDLVLLDSSLPDGTGANFMEKYMEGVHEKEWKIAPVVSMSGQTVQEQEEMYSGYQIYAYLQKPISKALLLDILRSVKQQ
eukprot:TRINITY_DN120242_c1_g1_i1.p1 TRINITY_DN120242_c1_g1~~TRINITY_DN120242_c1_g1_i1.p1  ORF type:complete len:714 (+),score=38.57 TRINITY_DN120242_c1_g1_i1:550-2691(+)